MAKATLHWKPLTFTQREACMKIILIGASGTLGKGIDKELCERHEIVRVGNSSGDFQVDISDSDSIRALFEKPGRFDALVAAVGKVHFGALEEMGEAQYQLGLRDKLMGQVNLVLLGREYANDGGSFTLTSGVLAEQPIRFGSSASMVNCAVEGFVRGAALELPRGLRINAVSPTVVSEALPGYAPYFRGFKPVPAADAALGYARSVEGAQTGQVYRIW
ncbi:short chain dehydrogenase [Pseudomonas aeruginosa]|nr:short chain dehydrogenase [Pseudomonas aeruginosa]